MFLIFMVQPRLEEIMYAELDIQTQTLYAELVDLLHVSEASRDKGSFAIKTNKVERYVYFRTYTTGGKLEELYMQCTSCLSRR